MKTIPYPIPTAFAVARNDLATSQLQRQCELGKNAVLTLDLPGNESILITVSHGMIWATMEGDASDFVIGPDEPLRFSTPGRLVLEGLERSNEVTIHYSAAEVKIESEQRAA